MQCNENKNENFTGSQDFFLKEEEIKLHRDIPFHHRISAFLIIIENFPLTLFYVRVFPRTSLPIKHP